jgi:hypothetical protein
VNGLPRRSASAAAVIVAVAAIGWAHTVLRGDDWAYEWMWALFQYQLVTVLVAPVVAGAAAWEAVALRAAAPAIRASGRATAFAGLVVVRIAACAAIGLAIGVVPVLVAVWNRRGLELPTAEALVTVVPALAQLVAVAATSFAVGTWWPRPVVSRRWRPPGSQG